MHTIATPGLWAAFFAVVVVALAVDFFVLRSNGAHHVAFREALDLERRVDRRSRCCSISGSGGGSTRTPAARSRTRSALEFLTGYVVEKSLAVDNIFVFLMVFNYFSVPAEQRQRALMLGVLGAIVLRAILIFIGAALVARFHWILYLFGLFLVFTGIKMLLRGEQGARSRSESGAALDAEAPAADARASTAARSASSRTAGAVTRRCSWSWC